MKLWKLAGTTAAMALCAGQAAFAVTPEEVWQAWQDASASYGQTVTAESQAREGDALVVTGLTVASDAGDEAAGASASSRVTIPEMRFVDQGDGSVRVTLSDSYQISVTSRAVPPDAAAGAEPVSETIVLDVSHPGLEVTATGAVGAMNYAFTAPTLSVALNSIDGTPAAEAGSTVKVDLTGMEGTYAITGTEARTIESDARAATLALDIGATDAATGASSAVRVTMADITARSSTATGTAPDLTDMAAALRGGFATTVAVGHGRTEFSVDATDPSGPTTVRGTATDGGLDIVMNAGSLTYGGRTNGLSATLSGAGLPVPEVTLGYEETAFNLAIPVSKSDAPAPFAFVARVTGLTVSDAVWSLFDPTAQLPRDPITLIVDLAGTATSASDLFAPAAPAEAGTPVQIDSLEVRQAQLRAIGAEVNATGALTFDNADLTTFQGMPAPTGTITIDASGINGVLDRLTAIGLLPEDQVAGARMMLGMFAKPGEGPDTLTSVLEFRDGGFFANGMQLR